MFNFLFLMFSREIIRRKRTIVLSFGPESCMSLLPVEPMFRRMRDEIIIVEEGVAKRKWWSKKFDLVIQMRSND